MQVSVDMQCRFSQPGFRQTGRWYGNCDNGLASGRGYGLIMDQTGDTVEFIGDARNGLANGFGGMIIQRNRQLGATYYEGGFKGGLPDGVVRVENAGELPKLRLFKSGMDIGKGNANQLKSLTFVSSSPVPGALTP